ncbi:kinase-like domain-containing protein [Rhizoctonia solani]|nr:kinase-like domain-containing protein [Rhizoctonia solani]
MPAPDIIKCLVQCGCPDATNDLRIPGPSSEPAAIGGYSDVYHGYLRDGTSVAIKCPRAPAAQGITGGGDNPNKVLKRAAKELYTWSTLNHPNIAKLLGVAMYLGRMSMVSPWISPGNFYYYVAKHRESVNHFDLCVQVAEGLAYLHGNSVIHGDLKACNVLVSEDGEVKLTDFGLSFLEESALRFTASQNHCEGTARWMAPELIQQSSPRCVETDVYAFGMTVVEIMTEAVPFAEIDSNGRVMYSVAHEGKTPTRPPRLAFGSAKNNTWWFILAQCWSPSARYRPTIEQVLRGLTSESWDRTINTWRLWTRKMSESLSSGMIHTHRYS